MGDNSNNRRAMFQFKPKIPPRKPPKPVAPKSEVAELGDATLSDELLKLVKQSQEDPRSRKNKTERKAAPVQVAFGYGQSAGSSRPQQIRFGARSTSIQSASALDGNGSTDSAVEDEYEEPFNYYSYYPISVPLRRPYSGDPELLDEKEFGEASASNLSDEESLKAAVELGLMEDKAEPQMFLFQFPVSLPLLKRSATAVGKEEEADPGSRSQIACKLQDLQAGSVGKMMVYENGTIKMKIGDALFDVSSSPECSFAQDVCVINTEEKHFCNLGELTKRAVVTPDIESMFSLNLDDHP
ncbi:uncharacterized protein LOC116259158 isoform X1 [Nymphaea colorata]|nr:uncharacterized protein LOC116259158 isoform X1 [Nymphaea colorata]XP_031492696.1 uncharacterized protein LOC116259158 isoform X1 [Nymphaea colorata]XP_031492704.1 uncharacterized protein LOC116259158 isoform X1 [Nymphaea colorata]XP_031492712.1 uncharacterized protein LOC116259158 isoform X1 [Nymphaea colorata]